MASRVRSMSFTAEFTEVAKFTEYQEGQWLDFANSATFVTLVVNYT